MTRRNRSIARIQPQYAVMNGREVIGVIVTRAGDDVLVAQRHAMREFGQRHRVIPRPFLPEWQSHEIASRWPTREPYLLAEHGKPALRVVYTYLPPDHHAREIRPAEAIVVESTAGFAAGDSVAVAGEIVTTGDEPAEASG